MRKLVLNFPLKSYKKINICSIKYSLKCPCCFTSSEVVHLFFASYSHFSLTFQQEELLQRPGRLPADKWRGRECSLSFVCPSHWLVYLAASPSPPALSPGPSGDWMAKVRDWLDCIPIMIWSFLTFFWSLLLPFLKMSFYHFLFLSLLLSFLSSSLRDSFSHGRRQHEFLKRGER